MKGATERWVTLNGKDVVANLFHTKKDFYKWAAGTPSDYLDHPTCAAVEEACYAKTQQKCKLYRLTRMEYVGYLVTTTTDEKGT